MSTLVAVVPVAAVAVVPVAVVAAVAAVVAASTEPATAARTDMTIRISMSPFSLEKLSRYSQFWKMFQDLVNVGNDVGNDVGNNPIVGDHLREVFQTNDWEFVSDDHLVIDTPNQYYDMAIRCLFQLMSTPNDEHLRNWSSCRYDVYPMIEPLLEKFNVDLVVRDRYHAIFPFLRQFKHRGNANFKFYSETSAEGKTTRWTGLNLLWRQMYREDGLTCKKCYKSHRWRAPLNKDDSAICKCSCWRTDEYVLSYTNPYYHEENSSQRRRDNEDALRRSDY